MMLIMKNLILARTFVVRAAIFIQSFLLSPTHAQALDPVQLFEKASKSIVVVFNYGEFAVNGMGSGVVIEPQKVITNCHVIQRAKFVEIKLGNAKYGAELLSPDIERDLCLLKVADLPSPAVEVVRVDSIKIGQKVFAIGAPHGLELTISDGLVSSIRGKVGEQFIQTTAPISSGSSGGGLFDDKGRLVGITTFIRKDSQNINFAVPAEYISMVPERGAAAIAAADMKNKQGQENLNRPLPEKKLTGEEIASLFENNPKIIGYLDGSEIQLDLSFRGIFNLKGNFYGTTWIISGPRKIDYQRDTICFYRGGPGPARVSPMESLLGCHSVYLSGSSDYFLRDVTSSDSKAIFKWKIST